MNFPEINLCPKQSIHPIDSQSSLHNSREGDDEKKEKTGCRPIGRISHEH